MKDCHTHNDPLIPDAGHPLFLRVQIEIYHSIAREGKIPLPLGLGSGTRDVIARFVDHLDPRDGQCLKTLSIPMSIDGSPSDYWAARMPVALSRLNNCAVSYSC